MTQNFPKMVYNAAGAYRMVSDADEAKAALADGYGKTEEKPKAKPKKVKTDGLD